MNGINNMKIQELNKIKKFLGITKKELILLQVFKLYNVEFDNTEQAIEYIQKKMEEK